jgi:hypothetical protein
VREICMLRAMWRELETELRLSLPGHEGGNSGYGQGPSYRVTAPALDPTRVPGQFSVAYIMSIRCCWRRDSRIARPACPW